MSIQQYIKYNCVLIQYCENIKITSAISSQRGMLFLHGLEVRNSETLLWVLNSSNVNTPKGMLVLLSCFSFAKVIVVLELYMKQRNDRGQNKNVKVLGHHVLTLEILVIE